MSKVKLSLALPVCAAVIAMISIQSGASLAKGVFPVVGPQGLTALRLGFSTLMMCAFWRPWRSRLLAQDRRAILIFGAALGLMNLSFYASLARIPLGVAVALEFTGPLAVAMASSRRPSDFLWIALAAGGLLLLLPIQGGASALDPASVGLALSAGFFWAIYIIFGQKAGAQNKGHAVVYGSLIGVLVVLPFAIGYAHSRLPPAGVIPVALLVALLSSAIPYSLEMIAMTRLPTRTFGILMSVEPAIAAVSGFFFLQERLSLLQLLAIVMIIVASGGTVATHSQTKPAAS